MKTQYQKLYEAGKKAGNLHISCLAGSLLHLDPKVKCPPLPIKLSVSPELKLGPAEKNLFNEISKSILSFCSSQHGKEISYCKDEVLDSASSFVHQLVAESEQFGKSGADFFKAGVLMRLIESISEKCPECSIQGLLIKTLGPTANTHLETNIWVLPGEKEFFASGFDIDKLRLSGSAWDNIRSGCEIGADRCGLFNADLTQIEDNVISFARELSIKSPALFPPVITPKKITFLISNTKAHPETWELTVSHIPTSPTNSLQKLSATFQEFTVIGKKKVEQLILAITEKKYPPINDSKSQKSLKSTFGEIKPNRSNLNKGFKAFYSGIRKGEVIKTASYSSYCEHWLANNVEDIVVDIV